MNKPIQIGQNVLDESKIIMSDFHFNFMIEKIGRENLELLFTDTNSLCYHITKKDPYKIIYKNRTLFDLSEFPKDHFLHDPTNLKVSGNFKIESAKKGILYYIIEFVGLRAKLYAYRTNLNKEEKRAKGTKRSVVKNELTFAKYNQIRLNDSQEYIDKYGSVSQNVIRSYEHKLYTENVSKVALNPLDDKSFILEDRITCLTHGHKRIHDLLNELETCLVDEIDSIKNKRQRT